MDRVHETPGGAVAWPELPHYAARLLRVGLRALGLPSAVISTRSALPISGVEELLGQPVHWIDGNDQHISWAALGLGIPRVLLVSGWSVAAFNRLRVEARAAGAQVVLLMDNPWKATPRQVAGSLWFRLTQRRHYAAIWVPGRAAAKLARYLGFPPDRTFQGLYAADPEVFDASLPLLQRPRKFIFVGQLIERKGIHLLGEAVRQLRRHGVGVEVDVFGTGPLASRLGTVAGLNLRGFLPSGSIAKELGSSRFLVLPSLEDHWPLVIHEAASCGCGVITTDRVGCASELLTHRNSWIYAARSVESLMQSLQQAQDASPSRLLEIQAESRRLAEGFSPVRWAATLGRIMALVHRPAW